MKQGTVKFSKEFITPIGLKEWASCEMEYDMSSENPKDVLTAAKNVVNEWYVSNNPAMPQMAPSTELPVINKAEERLAILIENAQTKEELMAYKNQITTPALSNLFSMKLQNFKI